MKQRHENVASIPQKTARSSGNGMVLDESGLLLTHLADIAPERIRWLWSGLIPAGALTLVIGDTTAAKSALTLDWAARISNGTPWPNGMPNRVGTTLFLSAEDPLRKMSLPRFLAAGGNRRRVVYIHGIPRDGSPAGSLFSLQRDLEKLESLIRRRGDVRLLVIDPLTAYLGNVNTSSDHAVRSVLTPLIAMAERCKVAVVGIMHMSKSTGRRAIYRSIGSVAFQALARAVWLVVRDPARGHDARLMLPVKFNLRREPPGIAYRITPAKGHPSRSIIQYESFDVRTSADEAMEAGGGRRESAEARAASWLRRIVQRRGKISSQALRELASRDAIAWRTIERVRDVANVRAVKRGKIWWYVWREATRPNGREPKNGTQRTGHQRAARKPRPP